MSKRKTQRLLSRRALLGGASVALSLPIMESLMPKTAQGQTQAIKRFLAIYVPNGIHMQDWTPTTTGTEWTVPYLLEPVADFKSDLLVLSGLTNEKQEEGPGDHAGGTGSFLTARTVPKTQTVAAGPSIDQVLANAIGQSTPLPSLEIAGEGGGPAGTCDSGYPCAFAHQISFDLEGTPRPKLDRPSAAFERLFSGFDPTLSAEEAARRNQDRTSVLDVVAGEAEALKLKMSTADQRKLDEYLTSVRELERRVAMLGGQQAACVVPEAPSDPEDAEALSDAFVDLIALAFQCDITRVITYMWGNAGSNRDYAFLGAGGGHHNISHHGGAQENLDKLRTISHWEVQQLAKLLTRLKAAQDADGSSVLDNTVVFFSSEISDGDRHNHDDMPVLLAGKLGGSITPGRHVAYDTEQFFGNLFVSIAQAFGVAIDTFGERGEGPLTGLT